MMKPNELFGVIVRTIGLLAVIQGACWYLVYGFLLGAGTIPETEPDEATMYIASGMPLLIAGCVLLRGADWFVQFSYPQAQSDESEEATSGPSSS